MFKIMAWRMIHTPSEHAVHIFTSQGWEVYSSDLYGMGWDIMLLKQEQIPEQGSVIIF